MKAQTGYTIFAMTLALSRVAIADPAPTTPTALARVMHGFPAGVSGVNSEGAIGGGALVNVTVKNISRVTQNIQYALTDMVMTLELWVTNCHPQTLRDSNVCKAMKYAGKKMVLRDPEACFNASGTHHIVVQPPGGSFTLDSSGHCPTSVPSPMPAGKPPGTIFSRDGWKVEDDVYSWQSDWGSYIADDNLTYIQGKTKVDKLEVVGSDNPVSGTEWLTFENSPNKFFQSVIFKPTKNTSSEDVLSVIDSSSPVFPIASMRKRILANGFFCHFLPNGPRCVRDSKTAYDASGIKLRPCQRNPEGVMVSTLPCVTLSRLRFTFDAAVGIKEARGAVMGSISATPNVGNVDSMEGDVFTFPLNAGLPF